MCHKTKRITKNGRINFLAYKLCTGWKEKFVCGYNKLILHLRFDGNKFQGQKNFFFFFLRCVSIHYEGKTFPRKS